MVSVPCSAQPDRPDRRCRELLARALPRSFDALTEFAAAQMDMQNWVGRGTVAPPDYRFVPAPGVSSTWPLLDQGNAHVSAVFVGKEPKKRNNIVMRCKMVMLSRFACCPSR